MKRTLFIGYGNPDREDDGVAWHILSALASRMGLQPPASYEEEFLQTPQFDFIFQLQLTPEFADDLHLYDLVCFLDAHTGSIQQDVRLLNIQADFQRSPLTHHLTPQSLLSICHTIHGKAPQASLLSVRGYYFRFSRQLSGQTAALVPDALCLAWDWLASQGVLDTLPHTP